MISVLCLAELLQCCSRFHVMSCFTAFSARQLFVETSVFASSPLHGDPVISRKTHWVSFRFSISQDTLGSRSVLYLTKHTNSWERLLSSRPSGHRARVILLQTQFLHASASTDHLILSFKANPSQRSTGSCSSPGVAGCTTARQAM